MIAAPAAAIVDYFFFTPFLASVILIRFKFLNFDLTY